MPTILGVTKRAADLALRPLGLETKLRRIDEKAEGFPGYLAEAREAGMDVNDWEEEKLGWLKPLPILEQVLFPYLRPDSRVCEIGPGTGRWSRHIADRVPRGEVHLVDHSPWMVSFLRRYFAARPHVQAHLGTGFVLPFQRDSWLDVVFATGTFVALKLGVIYQYAHDFQRVLTPGGHVVLDYIDPTSAEGWQHLESRVLADVYTFHAPEVLDRVFASAGFALVKRQQVHKSTYVVYQKPA